MADVFISYAREDQARAELIARELQAKGWSVWWDRSITIGRSFSRAIEQELDSAKCILVLWSSKSVDSEWVSNEAAEGLRREVLVPVRIDNVVRVPLEFRRLQTADLARWPEEVADFPRCVAAIQALVPLAEPSKNTRDNISVDPPRSRSLVIVAGIILGIIVIVLVATYARFAATERGLQDVSDKQPSATAPAARAQLPANQSVTDAASVLTKSDVAELEQTIAQLRETSAVDVRIHILPALPAGAILEDLTLRMARDSFGPEVHRGVMIVVFIADRKVRIEVGRALERLITDKIAASVISDDISPSFRRGAYKEGLRNAVDSIGRRLEAN